MEQRPLGRTDDEAHVARPPDRANAALFLDRPPQPLHQLRCAVAIAHVLRPDAALVQQDRAPVLPAPLAQKQAVQWMIADSATELHLARLVVMHAAWKIDQGEGYTPEVRRLG